MHTHIVTYRGIFPLDTYNRLIRFLYDNGIKYTTQYTLSKTPDDADLPRYYNRVIFWYPKYIEYRINRKKLTIIEYINKIRAELGQGD